MSAVTSNFHGEVGVPNIKDLVLYSPKNFAAESRSEFNVKSSDNGSDRGLLDAVRLDPAVLQVRLTLDNSQLRPLQPPVRVSEVSREAVSFEETVRRHQAALLSLSPLQYELLLKYADTLRRQRQTNQMKLECAFCKNNGAAPSWYTAHALKSWRGRVQCPVLRAHRCPRCGATGDHAHTAKYCPIVSPLTDF